MRKMGGGRRSQRRSSRRRYFPGNGKTAGLIVSAVILAAVLLQYGLTENPGHGPFSGSRRGESQEAGEAGEDFKETADIREAAIEGGDSADGRSGKETAPGEESSLEGELALSGGQLAEGDGTQDFEESDSPETAGGQEPDSLSDDLEEGGDEEEDREGEEAGKAEETRPQDKEEENGTEKNEREESQASEGEKAAAERETEQEQQEETLPPETKRQYAVSDYGTGDVIEEEAVYALGRDSFFYQTELSDKIFNRIYGKSYKTDCTIPREDLRYIRVMYYDFNGNRRFGELVSNKAISQDLVEIFKELYDKKYRIDKIRLVDDYDADDDWSSSENNTSCFNYRTVAGKSSLSLHARGLAIDINPRYNPNVFYDEEGNITGCLPANGMKYADRSQDFAHKIDENDLCVRLFEERGFTWGGRWTSEPDYMHFSRGATPET